MELGAHIEDFELPDQDGKARSLYRLLEAGRVVLFFYPAALSYGCTKESCHFRDLAGDFAALGAQRVGISPDSMQRQREFADRHGLDYPLLADTGGEIARRFGVRRSFGLKTKRRTFVIERDATLLASITSELSMTHHSDRALEVLAAK